MADFEFRFEQTRGNGWQTWTVTPTTDEAGRVLKTIADLLQAKFRASGAMIISGAQVEHVTGALQAGGFSTRCL